MPKFLTRFVRIVGELTLQARKPIDYRLLTEAHSDVVMEVGDDMRLHYVSPSVTDVLGWSQAEMLRRHADAIHPEDLPVVQAAVDQLKSAPEGYVDKRMFRMLKSDGEPLWVQGVARKLPAGRTVAGGSFIVSLRDVSEIKALQDRLSTLAMTDCVTGLANRRCFNETLQSAWRRMQRDGEPLSLLIADLDHFKGVNDAFGHQVGDDCLRSVCGALGSLAWKPDDVTARYGGEEIAMILPGLDLEHARQRGEAVRKAIADLHLPNPHNREGGGFVTASIGVASARPGEGSETVSPSDLLLAADNALYRAKRSGRNHVSASLALPGQTLRAKAS